MAGSKSPNRNSLGRPKGQVLLLALGLMIAQPFNGVAGGFHDTGSLTTARSTHTATLLPDGKVLVVGGANGAELYNEAIGTWRATGNPITRRDNHTETLLPNGQVLVVGGGSATYSLSSAELYDPATETWAETGSLTSLGRGYHKAALLPNGTVLVAGGEYIDVGYGAFSLWLADLYNPATGTWTATGNLTVPREEHAMTLLPNGKVLAAGGRNYVSSSDIDEILASAELYDSATGIWTATGSLATARAGHTMTLLPNDKVLVTGGATYVPGGPITAVGSAEIYDPTTETWTPAGDLITPRYSHTATLLSSNKVLIAGGTANGEVITSAELYDVATGTWSATGNLVNARSLHTATLLSSGEVLVAGGTTFAQPLATAEVYSAPPPLLNISTRLDVQTADNAMIGGFIITGTQPKTVIVRGLGPSLPATGALADPVIELHGPQGELLDTNDNWRDGAHAAQVEATLPPTNDLESALWGILDPGAYTVVLRGNNDSTGIGLFEVYDLDQTVDSELANISTRGFVQTENDVMIGGFITGNGLAGNATTVLVRALGPSITVADALADPTLELRDSSGTLIASNDDWKRRPDGGSQEAEIEATTIPPTNDLESALLQTLAPGNYTAIVAGKNGAIGVGLVETYNLE